jgi:hypothetical protein
MLYFTFRQVAGSRLAPTGKIGSRLKSWGEHNKPGRRNKFGMPT